jgi:hypothetical protein
MPRPTPVTSRSAAPAPLATEAESTLRLGPLNLALLAGGLAAIVIGFVLLGGGSTVAAPLLLVLGFAGLVPLGIIL